MDSVDVVEANDHNAILALLAGHILHVYVAHGWIEATTTLLLWFIVCVYLQHRLTALSNLHVAEIYILNHTATA